MPHTTVVSSVPATRSLDWESLPPAWPPLVRATDPERVRKPKWVILEGQLRREFEPILFLGY